MTKTDAAGTPIDAAGAPLAAGQLPLTITMMKASSSRFIALVGTVAILMLYVGFGLACLCRFASVNEIPDRTKVANFFYSGLVLFAPYLINKLSSVFSIFKPRDPDVGPIRSFERPRLCWLQSAKISRWNSCAFCSRLPL